MLPARASPRATPPSPRESTLSQVVIPEDVPEDSEVILSGAVSPVELSFDVHVAFMRHLRSEQIATPVAAILALTELIEASTAGTMFELVKALEDGADELKTRRPNPISVSAGCELFIAFVTLFPHESEDFSELKKELTRQGQTYAKEALSYRDKIANLALGFIKDDSVILTHSYSRVVMQTLLHAHKKKRISVFVTESRPHGHGLRTHELLTAAGIPCTVVLDSAVAYAMDKVDFVLVGSEAVVESGGLVNGVGSNQMAIIAKAANKPLYALAESYKFHRLFPLSQYDLPTHHPNILSFSRPQNRARVAVTARPSTAAVSRVAAQPPPTPMTERPQPVFSSMPMSPIRRLSLSKSLLGSPIPAPITMTAEQLALNPDVEYTRPDLISLVFSDVGILTPEGVSQYLVGMFAG